jgi:hypothetical protein
MFEGRGRNRTGALQRIVRRGATARCGGASITTADQSSCLNMVRCMKPCAA